MKPIDEISKKIFDRKDLPELVKGSSGEGKKIVFTNGCFDILHAGHIHLLSAAKKQGDLLIVGLNSDSSVKILKGKNRPVNNQYARSLILASLVFVDIVVIFSEETPLELICEINPNVLVKGGDYAIGNIVGSEHVASMGGKTVTIPLLKGYSSTNLIDKSGK